MTWPVIGPGVGSPSTGRGDNWVPRRNLAVFADPSFEPTLEPVESVEFYAVPMPGRVGVGGECRLARRPAVSTGESVRRRPAHRARAAAGTPSTTTRRGVSRPSSLLADERGLAGAGFWAIGYERGLPGYTELIATFRAGDLQAP